jgi:hypothetical protein
MHSTTNENSHIRGRIWNSPIPNLKKIPKAENVKYWVSISGRLYDNISVTVPIDVSTVTEINFVPLSPIAANARIAVSENHEIRWCAVPPILQSGFRNKVFSCQTNHYNVYITLLSTFYLQFQNLLQLNLQLSWGDHLYLLGCQL